jgi:hypothetical protein
MSDLVADYSEFIEWHPDGQEKRIPLEQGKIYMSPSGYKVQMEKHLVHHHGV